LFGTPLILGGLGSERALIGIGERRLHQTPRP
jgi:hypothetical protein